MAELEGFIVCCDNCGPVSVHKTRINETILDKNLYKMEYVIGVSAPCPDCGKNLCFQVASIKEYEAAINHKGNW